MRRLSPEEGDRRCFLDRGVLGFIRLSPAVPTEKVVCTGTQCSGFDDAHSGRCRVETYRGAKVRLLTLARADRVLLCDTYDTQTRLSATGTRICHTNSQPSRRGRPARCRCAGR